jgi:hypothetical protein
MPQRLQSQLTSTPTGARPVSVAKHSARARVRARRAVRHHSWSLVPLRTDHDLESEGRAYEKHPTSAVLRQ